MLSKEEYINEELSKPYKCKDIRTLIDKFTNGERIIFTKFGDGEYLCMTLQAINNRNCDSDTYTYELGLKLREAFCNLAERSNYENIYIGKWHVDEPNKMLLSLYYDYYIIR